MTNKQRLINCGINKPIDRSPNIIYFGPWPEALDRWQKENGVTPDNWQEPLLLDESIFPVGNLVNHLFYPWFEFKVLETRADGISVGTDYLGQTIEFIQGKSGIPKVLRSAVETRADWEKIKKEKLNPDDAARFPADWAEKAKEINAKDTMIQLGLFPCGLYGTLRDLMGVEESLCAFYDTPELVKDIMGYLTDFWIEIYGKVCRDVKVDAVHIWEDMSGKQGSMISPAMVSEFMIPNYRKIKDFAEKHDIPVMMVDTDGDPEELIPVFADGGVNMMMPFEVAAGCDIIALRKKYPYMSMMGGIDKMEIAKGKDAIDRELDRISTLINQTGFFPALDHVIPPEISYDDLCYYHLSVRDMILKG